MAEVLTVDSLLYLLTNLHNNGYGDMKIKCLDNELHEDEFFINYTDREVMFKGYLFNLPIAQKVSKFCDGVDKARKEFYQTINKESEEN